MSSSSMLAVVKPTAAPGAEVREVPIPKFGDNEVLRRNKNWCRNDRYFQN